MQVSANQAPSVDGLDTDNAVYVSEPRFTKFGGGGIAPDAALFPAGSFGSLAVAPPDTPAVSPTAILAVNSNTTYGVDTTAASNYGLGTDYMSTSTLQTATAAQQAVPSLWWLLIALVAIGVLI